MSRIEVRLLVLLATTTGVVLGASVKDKTGACGPSAWKEIGRRKCIKVIQASFSEASQLKTFEEARSICTEEDPAASLLTVASSEEQDFISGLLPATTVGNIWLGAQFINSSLLWLDYDNNNGDSDYSNWMENRQLPPEDSPPQCVEIETHRTLRGKWLLCNCTAVRNSVICQKPQSWEPSRMHEEILKMQKDFRSMQAKLETLETSTADLIPMGFIYVQYRNQAAPDVIWPRFSWEDVSSNFAGEFFRAVGGDSKSFGVKQEDNSPRLSRIQLVTDYSCQESQPATDVSIAKGDASPKKLRSGYFYNTQHCTSLTFTQTVGEVRPVNSAVRIWKRVR